MASDIAAQLRRVESVLGPQPGWPETWRTAIGVCLESAAPMTIGLGPELHTVYNEAYVDIVADKHPDAFGRPLLEIWPEIADALGPMITRTVRDGMASAYRDHEFLIARRGFLEEAFFTFDFTPVRSAGGTVEAVLNHVTETTYAVLARRRLDTVSRLALVGRQASASSGHLEAAVDALGSNPRDLPFVLLYNTGRPGKRRPALIAQVGLRSGEQQLLAALGDPAHGLRLAIDATAAGPVVLTDLGAQLPGLSAGPWPEPVTTAIAFRLSAHRNASPNLLVLGASPRLPLDEDYRNFLIMVADQLQLDLQLVGAAEAERERASNLEVALESSRHIGAAIGILMAARRITEAQAFTLLREASQDSHRKLRDIADYVVETGALPAR